MSALALAKKFSKSSAKDAFGLYVMPMANSFDVLESIFRPVSIDVDNTEFDQNLRKMSIEACNKLYNRFGKANVRWKPIRKKGDLSYLITISEDGSETNFSLPEDYDKLPFPAPANNMEI